MFEFAIGVAFGVVLALVMYVVSSYFFWKDDDKF